MGDRTTTTTTTTTGATLSPTRWPLTTMQASSLPWLASTNFLAKARPQGLTQLQDQQILPNQQIQQIQPAQRIHRSLREVASRILRQDFVLLSILRMKLHTTT